MKRQLTLTLLVGAFISTFFSSCSYNSLVSQQETISSQWAQVENAYQRRADLIPNLVNTVKGYAEFEQETLTKVIEARSKATQVNLNVEDLTEENMAKFEQAQAGLSSALSRLLVVAEQYPNLKANQNFLELQAQLEGTENRISVERGKFNTAVQEYNTTVRRFPSNLTAMIFGFKPKAYFQAKEGSDKVPEVKF